MKALITGVAGFVGSTLAERLLSDGNSVTGIDAITSYYSTSIKRANLAPLMQQENFEFIEADLLDVDLKPLLRDIDFVFHQAGQPGVRSSWGDEFAIYTRANVDATQRLLEAAVGSSRLQRLIYASSSSVYGNAERFPTFETDVPQPMSPYGVTKLAAEHLCSLYAENFGVPTISLRYFTVYGPKQRPDMAFTRFTRAAALGEPISIYGDGEQVRDFTFISDIVQANVLAAAAHGIEPGTVLNVAGGSSTTVNEVLDILRVISGKELVVQYQERLKGDVRQTGGSTDRIRKTLNWVPTHSLQEGLEAQYEWAIRAFDSSL